MSPDQLPPIELRLAGYCPKRVVGRPAFIDDAPSVVDICSVSHCISEPPSDWIDHWLHNALGFFDTPDLARQVIPPAEDGFTVFAYRVGTVRFDEGRPEVWEWPEIDPEERAGYRSLGFDVVGKTETLGFEHSPLSCNGIAVEYPVNSHCLLDDLAIAIKAAEQFSIEQPEPGRYYVVEVLVPPGTPESISTPESS
jgi:hypothetical protein